MEKVEKSHFLTFDKKVNANFVCVHLIIYKRMIDYHG